MELLWLSLSVVVGFLVPIQSGANARLSQGLDDTSLAVIVSLFTGMVGLLLVRAASGMPWPSLARLATVPWWAFAGGLISAAYLGVAAKASPLLGVALFSAAFVFGQFACSITLDHFGWMGFPVRELTLSRLLGVGLIIAGVLVVRFK